MTMDELQQEFETEMMKKHPGLFLDTLPNGEYSHPDVYHTWMLYRLIGIFFFGVKED